MFFNYFTGLIIGLLFGFYFSFILCKTKLPKFENIQKIIIKDETILVFTTNCNLSEWEYERLMEAFRVEFNGIKCILLDGGIKLISTVDKNV